MKILSTALALATEYLSLRKESTSSAQREQKSVHDSPGGDLPSRRPPGKSAGLRRTPVFFANVDKIPIVGNLTSRSHGFAIVGDPGQGNKSGAVYFGVSGDGKRGGIDVDAAFVGKVSAGRQFGTEVKSAVDSLGGKSYPSREAFGRDYISARLDAAPDTRTDDILQELKALSFLVPKEKWELWPLEKNGVDAAKPNLQERDVRTFENVGKKEGIGPLEVKAAAADATASGDALHFHDISLRPLPDVDVIALIEAKRQQILARLYLDEVHGRDGSGVPTATERPPAGSDVQRSVASGTPTYQRLPPFDSGLTANCNAGAASLVARAQPAGAAKVKPGSNVAFGVQHRARLWQPTDPVPTEPSAQRQAGYEGAANTLENMLEQRTKVGTKKGGESHSDRASDTDPGTVR